MTTRRAPLLLFLLLAACTGLRELEPGVWRSPQPGEDQLARRIEQLQLRTVVCLRGDGAGTASSRRAAENSGAAFLNVPMSATRAPRPETLLELWQIAATAKRPLLLHCMAGADRTGLASAIFVLHDSGDLDRARGELTILHGHLAFTATGAMDAVLDKYEPFAGKLAFPAWVEQVYGPAYAAEATATR
ncbi:MAG TPA: tyrosine-protein phosphatase [Planctomycetota bacterium]|nr:tyrosine-protein phosphatase [Planctomycetota bacterium]